ETVASVQEIVRTNDKQRFNLITEIVTVQNDDGTSVEKEVLYIRANQGHSLQTVEVAMDEITSPEDAPVVVHGTFGKFWPKIAREGLKVMNRQHMHFAAGLLGQEGVISGMRKTCDVFIYIDMEKAVADGIKFYRSANNVILSSGMDGVLEPKYFRKVVGPKGQRLDGDM
ncbi:hypothetical protein HK104_006989, partial [Borealophlyctis nickersoniae]